MQPPTDGPRGAYTEAQVRYLIENTTSFDTDMGLELIDGLDTMNVQADVSEWVSAAQVSRNNLATIHASATFALSTDLSGGNTIVRPYMTVTGPTSATATTLTTMKFYLGAYFVDAPETDLSESTPTWDATGFDVLSILDDSIGDDYAVNIGELYLTRVEQILLDRGITKYHIDQEQAGAVVASPKVYTLDEDPTWLQVVNDCLAAVGYQGIWTDWNGYFQVRAYQRPADRSPEWTLTAKAANTLLTQRRKLSADYYNAPNRWVFYQSNVSEEQPVDGNGRYEYTNQSVGPTSVEARRGRVITAKPEGVDVADHAALVAYAQRVIDLAILIPRRVSMETAPFPLAWHMDRYLAQDPGLGSAFQVLGTSWTLNLNGSDMGHEWSEVI